MPKRKGVVTARLRAGHARPLLGGSNGLCTRGAREGGSPPLRSWRVVARERVVTQGPSKPLRPRKLGQLPCEGSLLRGQSPREKPPLSKGGAERKRGGGIPARLRV